MCLSPVSAHGRSPMATSRTSTGWSPWTEVIERLYGIWLPTTSIRVASFSFWIMPAAVPRAIGAAMLSSTPRLPRPNGHGTIGSSHIAEAFPSPALSPVVSAGESESLHAPFKQSNRVIPMIRNTVMSVLLSLLACRLEVALRCSPRVRL